MAKRTTSIRHAVELGGLRGVGRGGRVRARGGAAGKVVERGGSQGAADDAKAGAWGVGGGVLEGVPPDVGLAEHGAADVVPESLGVLGGGDGLAKGLAADGVAGLGDPDGLPGGGGLGLTEGVEEELLVVLDAVVEGVLEVGVGVDADPVTGVSDGLVGAVDPSGPGVDVANWCL